MTYDLIIVSQSVGDLIKITENCIASARLDKVDLNVIIVETANPYKYDADKIIQYNGEFNYNRALNMGLKYAKSDFQILANNDLIFKKGWSNIGALMQLNGYLSGSALSNDRRQQSYKRGVVAYEGYGIGYELTGWCIFTDKKLWDKIGKLDEKHVFWYSDNDYADQLKAHNIKHALFCCVEVDHLGSKTLNRQSRRTQFFYTYNAQRTNI